MTHILQKSLYAVMCLFFVFKVVGQSKETIAITSASTDKHEREYMYICYSVDASFLLLDTSARYVITNSSGNSHHFDAINKDSFLIDALSGCFRYRIPKIVGATDSTEYAISLLPSDTSQVEVNIGEFNIKVRSIVDQVPLFAGDLRFRGFDSSIDSLGSDYYMITTTRELQPGMSFGIAKAEYDSLTNLWTGYGSPDGAIGAIGFTYLGGSVYPTGSNLCIVIPGNNFDLLGDPHGISVSLNGDNMTQDFSISNAGSSATLNVGMNAQEPNPMVLYQGAWMRNGGGYQLIGQVLDEVDIGSGYSGGNGLHFDNHEQEFYGIIICDGQLYICDLSAFLGDIENWTFEYPTEGSFELDPELCDSICGIIACPEREIIIELNLEFLEVQEPCEGATYLWNTGETSPAIIYDPQYNPYSVTVTCPDSCTYVGTYDGQGLQPPPIVYSDKCIVYPNPAQSKITVEYTSEHSGPVRFTIYDITGRPVFNNVSGCNIGLNKTSLSVSQLYSGVYLLKLTTEHEMYPSVPIVITHDSPAVFLNEK